MNIILGLIKSHNYWIHWEDTWYPERPFLESALTYMDNSNTTQVQLTKYRGITNWLNVEPERINCKDRICTIAPANSTLKYMNIDPYSDFDDQVFFKWPLYSLLPSINRAAFYEGLGNFLTDEKLRAIKFEWDFARRWFQAGGTKAVMKDGPIVRDEAKHASTHE